MRQKFFLTVTVMLVIVVGIGVMQQGNNFAIAAQEPVEITFMFHGVAAEKPMWEEVIQKFTSKHPDIKVRTIPCATPTWGDYFDKALVMIAGGNPPDVMRVAIEGTQLFASKGLALPLDSLIQRNRDELKDYFDDVHPALLEAFKYKGKIWELPMEWNNMVIFYNKNVLKNAGIPFPKKSWTKDDFLKICRQVTKDVDGDGENDIWGYVWSQQYFAGVIPWMFVAGSGFLNDEWTASLANDPKTIEAEQFLQDLIWKYKVSPSPVTELTVEYEVFAKNKAAFIGGGRWPVLSLINLGLTSADFDIQYFPKWRTQTVEFGVGGFPILKESKHVNEAWELVKFFTTVEAQYHFTNLGWSIPARKSVAESDAMFRIPPDNARIYYASLDEAKPVPSPPEYAQIEQAFMRYQGLVFSGEITAKEAMEKLHREITKILEPRVGKVK